METSGSEAALAYLKTLRKKDVSILESAVLLQALSGGLHDHAITRTLAKYLGEHCTEQWIQTAPLATVFAVANALHSYNAKAISGRHIGVLAQRLIQSEQAPGGPYAQANEEPDFFTNVLIAVFASWAAGSLPGTTAYLQQSLAQNSTTSATVPPYIVWRYLALLDDFTVNDVETPTSVEGTFSAAALLWQSETTAPVQLEHDDLTRDVFEIAHNDLAKLGEPLAAQAAKQLERIESANVQHEITLLPYYFASALRNPAEDTFIDYTRLGVANVFCWLSYMTFDHILDDARDIDVLPLASIAYRKTLQLYRRVSPDNESLVEATFTRMDQANAWELQHTRARVENGVLTIDTIPNYGNGAHLANRSFAHVLGPLCIAIAQGNALTSEPLKALRTAFWHYLIARQLNDDAHDWQDDLANGQITIIVAELLKARGIQQGTFELSALIPELQHIFRTSIAERTAERMILHTTKAIELFRESGLLANGNMLEQLCSNIAASAERMVELSQQGEDLLSTFNN